MPAILKEVKKFIKDLELANRYLKIFDKNFTNYDKYFSFKRKHCFLILPSEDVAQLKDRAIGM